MEEEVRRTQKTESKTAWAVWKFPVWNTGEFSLEMPERAEFLAVRTESTPAVFMYARVQPNGRRVLRRFRVLETGEVVDDQAGTGSQYWLDQGPSGPGFYALGGRHWKYIGSFEVRGQLDAHLFAEEEIQLRPVLRGSTQGGSQR